jgi:hypothetical protein
MSVGSSRRECPGAVEEMLTFDRRVAPRARLHVPLATLAVAVAALFLVRLAAAAAAGTCVNPAGSDGCFSTIQAAIDDAVAAHQVGSITIAPGTYTENLNVPSGANIALKGGSASAVFTVIQARSTGTSAVTAAPNTTLRLNNLAVTGGQAAQGGGISSAGNLSLTNVVLSQNTAVGAGAKGGGLYFAGPGKLDIEQSLITSNSSSGSGGDLYIAGNAVIRNSIVSGGVTSGAGAGGGIAIAAGQVQLVNTTVEDNAADGGNGAGVWVGGGQVVAVNTSVALNFAAGTGGGVELDSGSLYLNNCTVALNASGGPGGGVNDAIDSDSVAVSNTIVGDNTSGSGGDCQGTLYSIGYNLIGNPAGCTVTGAPTGNVSGDPQIGGFTCAEINSNQCVVQVEPASPAIGGGNPAVSDGRGGDCAATDALGTPRPKGDCDMGAYQAP